MDFVTIYNDGKLAIQLITMDDGSTTVGTIDGELNGAIPDEFIHDLPVNRRFLDGVKNDEASWRMINDAIAEGIASRSRS